MHDITIKSVTDITPAQLGVVMELMQQLPEFDQEPAYAELKQRLYDKQSLLMLCYVGEQVAGFQLGYALDSARYYCWLGGVLPGFRGLGLAQQMLTEQEQWAVPQGYKAIQIKTCNRFKALLRLLIKNDYQVIDFTPVADDISQHRLSLQKQLAVAE